MKILLVHNYTQNYARGGEAHVFEDEIELLRAHGHEVETLTCANAEAMGASRWQKLFFFLRAPWSSVGHQLMREKIEAFRPDVIHVHNYFLILSPKIFKAAKDCGVPVVVTLHNYRLVSPCSLLFRKGRSCELCVGKNPWRILFYRCYKDSFVTSLLRYRFYYLSDRIHKWRGLVDRFFVLTAFAKQKLMEAGLPEEKLIVKPNSTADAQQEGPPRYPGHGALFIGCLTQEKGILTLADAWSDLDYPLTVLGEGDKREIAEQIASSSVDFRGLVPREEVREALRKCAFVVMPSTCYESFGLVTIEAFSMGKPVLASGHGAMSTLIEDGVDGWFFEPGNAEDLRAKVQLVVSSPDEFESMGRAAREKYEQHFTPTQNYEALIGSYRSVTACQGATSC